MSDDDKIEFPVVKQCKPHQVGWLRRPECDRPGIEVWEQPDGRLYAHDPREGKLLLDVWRYPKVMK